MSFIAGFRNGYYYGEIWKHNIKIADYEGVDLEIIIENLCFLIDTVLEKTIVL